MGGRQNHLCQHSPSSHRRKVPGVASPRARPSAGPPAPPSPSGGNRHLCLRGRGPSEQSQLCGRDREEAPKPHREFSLGGRGNGDPAESHQRRGCAQAAPPLTRDWGPERRVSGASHQHRAGPLPAQSSCRSHGAGAGTRRPCKHTHARTTNKQPLQRQRRETKRPSTRMRQPEQPRTGQGGLGGQLSHTRGTPRPAEAGPCSPPPRVLAKQCRLREKSRTL